jgi:hypothetical protein
MAELLCVYGSTGSYKTAQLHFIAKYVYERWGKRTRLASCDGGGWKPLDPDIDAGLIEAWQISAIDNPRSIMRKLSQGYWPEAVRVGDQMKLVLQPPTAATWERIGCVAHEGLTSTANIIMRDALNKQMIVAGDQKGEKGAIKFEEKVNVADGVGSREIIEKYSFATPGNYNDAQRAVYDFATNYRSLPCPLVYFTALEARGEEDETRKTIIGPAVIGKAVTGQVGTWVGDLIHAEDYYEDMPDPSHKPKQGEKQRTMQVTKARYWFIRHPDPLTGLLFPAKPRVAPELIPELMKIFPGGYFEPTTSAGIDAYLKAVDAIQAKATGSIKEWMAAMDAAREAAKTVGGDAPAADKDLIKATTGGK